MQACPLSLSALRAPLFAALFIQYAEVQEFSSVGRASVSKTEGRGFESPNSCHFCGIIKQMHHGRKLAEFRQLSWHLTDRFRRLVL
jgi:hypothetical protein